LLFKSSKEPFYKRLPCLGRTSKIPWLVWAKGDAVDTALANRLKAQYDQKATDLVAQMSLKEKVHLMGGNTHFLRLAWEGFILNHYNRTPWSAGGNKRLDVPAIEFCDGPRGLVSGHATCFPVSMQRGASFDIDLEERIGQAIGKEIRATGGNYFGGVCINLLRHPAGGRAQETYGEDPFHVGQMGAALTRGVQKHNVMACVKHYAVNNQENTRFQVDVTCDERTLREVYLPHFKDCIDAGAASVMGAYNKFRGAHCCHNAHLLRRILKEEWDFYGFVISDFVWGVRATAEAANGGLDVEMPFVQHYGKKLVRAVEQGNVAEDVIDEAARRIVRTILMFAEADDPLSEYAHNLVACQEHIDLALEAAEKSMVLLKNDGGILPFDRRQVKKVALLGRLGRMGNIGDRGSSQVHPPYIVTPREGLQKLLGTSVEILYSDGQDLAEAKMVTSQADASVFVVGCDHNDEGEFIPGKRQVGGDREHLGLHAEDVALINAVAPLNKNTVVVLIGGSAIMMEEWKASVPAILYAFYPGMEGGTALARMLFGEVNPGGKLPFSIPANADHLPAFDKEGLHVEYDLYHGYTKLEKEEHEPAFAFGFGLSYTTFSQANAAFTVKDGMIKSAVDVTNTGQHVGDQVVQLYVGAQDSVVERAPKLLRGFKRITVLPGETKRVVISCPLEKLRCYNPDTNVWELERTEYQAYIGFSSKQVDLLSATFVL
jgi:beta-glucosidase